MKEMKEMKRKEMKSGKVEKMKSGKVHGPTGMTSDLMKKENILQEK